MWRNVWPKKCPIEMGKELEKEGQEKFVLISIDKEGTLNFDLEIRKTDLTIPVVIHGGGNRQHIEEIIKIIQIFLE